MVASWKSEGGGQSVDVCVTSKESKVSESAMIYETGKCI